MKKKDNDKLKSRSKRRAPVIQGTEETERLVFDGICLSAES